MTQIRHAVPFDTGWFDVSLDDKFLELPRGENMKRTRDVIVAIVMVLIPSLAEADQLDGKCANVSGEVVEYGLARGELQQEIPDQGGGASGVVWVMKNIRLVEKTDRIPLASGNMILVRYRLSGLRKGSQIKITNVTTFPAIVGPDGRSSTRTEQSANVSGDKTVFNGEDYWTFDAKYPYEWVVGQWSFNYFHDGCLLMKKDFETIKP
jgi:hypothetical protein